MATSTTFTANLQMLLQGINNNTLTQVVRSSIGALSDVNLTYVVSEIFNYITGTQVPIFNTIFSLAYMRNIGISPAQVWFAIQGNPLPTNPCLTLSPGAIWLYFDPSEGAFLQNVAVQYIGAPGTTGSIEMIFGL